MKKNILLYINSAYYGAISPLVNAITKIEAEEFINY